jgi:hypothetical protein
VWLIEQDTASEKLSLIDSLKFKHEKKKPHTAFDIKCDLKEYATTCQTRKAHHSTVLTIGLVLLAAGLTMLIYSNKTQLAMRLTKKKYPAV